MDRMRPLIIGGGVAGTVAALAAQRAGFAPRVFEAYPASTGLAHGAFLTVAVNGLDALRAVGAAQVVTDGGFASRGITFFSGTGKPLGQVALGPELPDGTVTHTIRRDVLYHGLAAEVVRRGIPFVHGKRLVRTSRTRDCAAGGAAGGVVTAYFDDGTTAEGDVLVGADGVNSTTRALIDPLNPAPRYTGLGNVGGFTTVDAVADFDGRPGDYVMVWGRECFFGWTVSPTGEVWWFANPPSGAALTKSELKTMSKRDLVALLDMDRTPGARIVAATEGPLNVTNQVDLPRVPTWHRDGAVLVGDAAHAVSPSSGQGASLAAEDAVELMHCLQAATSVDNALANYQQVRRGRVERVVSWAAGMNNTKKQGFAGRLLRDLAVPIIMRRNSRPGEMDKMAWLFDHQAPALS